MAGSTPSNSSPSRRGCWCCAASIELGIDPARHFSSRMFDKIKAYSSLEQSIGSWSDSSEYHNVFFHLSWTWLTRPDIILFQKSRSVFMVQIFKKQMKQYTGWILHRIFLEWSEIVAVFSNWYWNSTFKILGFRVYSVIFRVGSIGLTKFPLQKLRT